ncbi:MAG: Transposase IS200 like protein [Planctomycetes bacterium ADurb.Bin126]|nr:MAG: Transposase IS200 like protein [Planctomycetes bacterium ADurb.Bin126]HOD84385.1 transposase [Phycisphaerae bacterium]HQL76311.1 transposase [Phycisphaerae bacterium]
MARLARVVVPGCPHHVTQRGNRRYDVFWDPRDRDKYETCLLEYARKYGLDIWAYCWMTNHVHLVAVPHREESLAQTLRDTHTAYTSYANRRMKESGHLWQGRFFSTPLDEGHLWSAVRYVERNPVRAGLVARAEDYPWSSAAAHCGRRRDGLLSPAFPPPDWTAMIPDWSAWLGDENPTETAAIRRNTHTGRPCGTTAFIRKLESLLGRLLLPQKAGRKPKNPKPDSKGDSHVS